jgi:hypothetical protein
MQTGKAVVVSKTWVLCGPWYRLKLTINGRVVDARSFDGSTDLRANIEQLLQENAVADEGNIVFQPPRPGLFGG